MATRQQFRLSFEFFPPKTDKGQTALLETAASLSINQPVFFSVTYGAGGSTRDRTFEAVAGLNAAGREVAPHLSMGSDDKSAVTALIDRYLALGIRRMVALRGDIPSGFGNPRHASYAINLVTLLRAHAGDAFEIEVTDLSGNPLALPYQSGRTAVYNWSEDLEPAFGAGTSTITKPPSEDSSASDSADPGCLRRVHPRW